MTHQEEGRYDWHDSWCGGGTWDGFDGLPVTLPCDCGESLRQSILGSSRG